MPRKVKLVLALVIAVAGAVVCGQGVEADNMTLSAMGAVLGLMGCVKLYQEFD